MKYLVLVASLAAFASAQLSLSGLPDCAKGCIGTALPKQCSALAIGCICNDKNFLSGLSCCISKSCNQADQDATIKFASQLCATAQVTIGSTSLGCAATQAPGSSTGGAAAATSANGSASSALSSQTSAAGSLVSSASSAAASATGNVGAIAQGISGLGAAGAAAAVFAFL